MQQRHFSHKAWKAVLVLTMICEITMTASAIPDHKRSSGNEDLLARLDARLLQLAEDVVTRFLKGGGAGWTRADGDLNLQVPPGSA